MGKLHILDTNVVRSWIDASDPGHSPTVSQVREIGETFLAVSVVTVGEVEFGLARPHKLSREKVREIRAALARFREVNVDRHVCHSYGRLRAWLLGRFAPQHRRKLRSVSELVDPVSDRELGIQENDLWIASQAITFDAVLVSKDRMARIAEAAKATGQDLQLVSWW